MLQVSTVLRRAGFLILISFGLYSCNPSSYKPLFKSRYDSIADTLRYTQVVNSKSPASDIYRIQPYDMLSVRNITIKQIEDGSTGGGAQTSGQNSAGASTGGFRVENDGFVSLPIIGKVEVANLTRKEATDKIQALYKTSYLKDPLIDVSIIYPKVTILGEVESEGTYGLTTESTSILEVIGMAGGLTNGADPKRVKIIRGNKANPEIIYVNLENLQSAGNPKTILQNSDVIYVGQDKRISAYEKSQSGFGIFQSVFLVISTGLLIFTSFFK